MDKKAIAEYNSIMNTFEVIVLAMKRMQDEKNKISQDSIIEVSERLLKDLQRFCINHVGFIEE